MSMGRAGAPEGNTNAAKGRVWGDALRRAIAQDDGKRVRAAVDALLDEAAKGEAWAIKELADRLDGKPAQAITGEGGGPLRALIGRLEDVIVDPADRGPEGV